MTGRFHLYYAAACVLLTFVSFGAGLGFDPAGDPTPAASMYMAPENALIFRMRQPDGSFRQFERYNGNPRLLRGAEGWTGRLEGSQIRVMTPPEHKPSVVYCFERGTLKWYACDGKTNDLSSVTSPALPAELSPLNYEDPSVAFDKSEYQAADLWRDRQRLQFPFLNPNRNGVLYVQLLLLGFLLASLKRRALVIVGYSVAVVSAAALLMTASRSSFLACAAAVLPIVILKGRKLLTSRRVWITAAIVLAFGAAWFMTHDDRLLTRGFKKTSWSNRIRADLAKASPRMMADAPGGWGFAEAGHAYVNWYQPLDAWCLTGSMMNDHLTVAVNSGRPIRIAYVFGWLSMIVFLCFCAVRSRDAVPLGFWSSMAVAASFNPVMGEWTLWMLPVVAFGYAAVGNISRMRLRKSVVTVLVLAAIAVASVYLVEWLGGRTPQGVPVRAEGRRVLVNGSRPQTWIVDDGLALAGPLTGKDIRTFYESCPEAPAIGYVGSVDDLPPSGIAHLVLAGYAGDAWLRKLVSSPGLQRSIPPRITFISPPFPPSAVPPPLLSSASVRICVGELIARYGDAYRDPPAWVTFVPGSEFYLLRWMWLLW